MHDREALSSAMPTEITHLHTSQFRSQNPQLVELPNDVLTSEGAIVERLENLDKAQIPFAEKVAWIDKHDFWPFVMNSRLCGEFQFLIDVADNLENLRLYRVDTSIAADELNSEINFSNKKLELLATIPDPTLVYSAKAIATNAAPGNDEMITQLYGQGRRMTRYRGVTVTWDQAVDRRVWTTNIDTLNYINQLYRDGFFRRSDIKATMEVGVGGGGISKTVLSKMPGIEEHIATDIWPYAIKCAERNISPLLAQGRSIQFMLGKGIKSISAIVDALLVNPPYIPTITPPTVEDPYRGTGLIQEIIQEGPRFLRPGNPNAVIYMGMSNLAELDLQRYLAAQSALKMERLGTPMRVPLKILKINENAPWLEFLEKNCGLIRSPELLKTNGFEFWHNISVIKLTRASS